MKNTYNFARWTVHTHNQCITVTGRLTLDVLIRHGIFVDDIIAIEER